MNDFDIQITSYNPKVTQRDIEQGFITRYFVSKKNQLTSEVYEVTHSDVKSLANNPYIETAHLNWTIRGKLDNYTVKVYTGNPMEDGFESITVPGVIQQNKGAVEYLSKKIPAIKKYLTKFDQFYLGA